MSLERPLESLSDDELLGGLASILSQSRRAEAELVAHIGEVEARRLYAREAAPSMFVYCTDALHLSEAEAYLRINVARAARKHPALLSLLADGRLHLSGIVKLAPHLTPENRDLLLVQAVHKSKRQIEELLAELTPRPDIPGTVRKLPDRPIRADRAETTTLELGPGGVAELCPDGVPELGPDRVAVAPDAPNAVSRPIPSPPAVVQPLSPSRYKVQFTAGAELLDKRERLRALLRHEVPDGDLAAIVENAVSEKLERLEARRFARSRSPWKESVRASRNPSSRHVPAAVRRAVHRRDRGQCCFVDARRRRCPERYRLEYHHRHPFGLDGNHDPDNVCLMCPAHNRLMAELDYGKNVIARHWRAASGRSCPETTRGPVLARHPSMKESAQ